MNATCFIKRVLASPQTVLLACLPLIFSGAACNRSSEAHVNAKKQPAPARAQNKLNDADRDGIPDGAELSSFNDRENFRQWFTGIAEIQFYELSKAWNVEQRDCSGLVRFAWREALRKHDNEWFQKMGGGAYDQIASDVNAYDLERGLLGEKLFRTNAGTFKEADISDGSFSEFADARTLKSFNSIFVSRKREEAKPGDLLFYYQPWVQKYPYHVMIYLGEAREAAEGAGDWVVYHTGASPIDEGAVKKVRLAVLDQHPDPRWRPIENNKNFLGFYRLKILN
jgi:uncharacterized protein YfaT (DUF1175 family)